MKLEIDESKIQSVVAGAIFEHLTDDNKRAVMETVLKHLIAPTEEKRGYETVKVEPPLTQAFKRAADHVAHKIVTEMLEDEKLPYKKQIRSIVKEGLDRLVTDKEGLVKKMTEGLEKSFHDFFTERYR